jgi:hypothetical protein
VKTNRENQTVNVKIDTDLIAQHLHYAIGDHPNGAALVESIIGVGLVSGKLGHMFMGSLGVIPTQKYGIGEELMCSSTIYDYFEIVGADRAKPREIGQCRVVEYRPYNDEQYVVEYTHVDRDGDAVANTSTVTVSELCALPLQPPTEIECTL